MRYKELIVIFLFLTGMIFAQKSESFEPMGEEFSTITRKKFNHAVEHGDMKTIQRMVASGNLPMKEKGYYHRETHPLQIAVEKGDTVMISLLMDLYKDKDESIVMQRNNLIRASIKNHDIATLKLLYAKYGKSIRNGDIIDNLEDCLKDSVYEFQPIIYSYIDTLIPYSFRSLVDKAIRYGAYDLLKMLVMDYKGNNDSSGLGEDLYSAIEKNNMIVLRILVESPATNINSLSRYSNLSSLMIAAIKNNIEALKILIEKGADLETEGKAEGMVGVTAVMYAAWHGNEEAFDLLVKAGANLKHRDADGHSIIPPAVKGNNLSIFDKCMNAGFDLTEEIFKCSWILEPPIANNNMVLFKRLMEAGALKNPFIKKFTLTDAALAGNLEMVQIMADSGAELSAIYPDKYYWCGFDAVGMAALEGHWDVVEYLVDKGCSLNTVYTCPANYGYKLMEVTEYRSKRKTAWELIDLIPFKALPEFYPLIKKYDQEYFEKNINQWLTIDFPTNDYRQYSLNNLIKLHELGADLNQVITYTEGYDEAAMEKKATLLQYMIIKNREQEVEYLLLNGVDCNKMTEDNISPLFLAINKDAVNKSIVTQLIHYGAKKSSPVPGSESDIITVEKLIEMIEKDDVRDGYRSGYIDFLKQIADM